MRPRGTDQADLAPVSPALADDPDRTRTAAGRSGERSDAERTSIGRYRILAPLGEGGMGRVFAAEDPELHRRVAIKILRVESPHATERLLREARAMAQLRHPNVVTVYEVGRSGANVFIAMELVEGTTLRDWLTGDRSLEQRLQVMRLAGEGLAAAHEQGLIHRDFKPDNVMVGADGRPQVVDFGVAKLASSSPDDDEQSERPDRTDEGELTRSGALVGTPAYMAPEQFLHNAADHRSDQFSYCSVLFEALYGERPFAGKTVADIRARVLAGERSPIPARRDVPDRVARAIERGLSTDPNHRFPDMRPLLAELQTRPRRTRVLWAAVAAIVLVVAGAWVWAATADDAESTCASAGDAVDQVWSESAAQAIATAFAGSDASYAPAAATRVNAILESRATAWASTRRRVCEATWVRGEQSEALLDLRMSCLDRRLSELRFFVALHSGEVDRALVARAAQAALFLEPSEACATATANSAAFPTPRDPDSRRRLAALQERIDELEVMFVAGRYRQGVAAGEAVVADADAFGHPPTQAEALLVMGELLAEAGEHERAEATFARGIVTAMRAGDYRRLAQMYAKRISLIGVEQDRHAEALILQSGAEAALVLADDARLLRAELLRALGTVHMEKGDLDAARDQLESSLALYQDGPADDPRATATLNNLGLVFYHQGKYEEAIAYLAQAHDSWQRTLGPEHPWVAATVNNLASAYLRLGRLDEALARYQQALELQSRSLGPDHPDVAAALTNVGVVLDQQGKPEEARDFYLRALALREATLGPHHQKVGIAAYNLGNHLLRQNQTAAAVPYLRRAVEAFEASVGPDHDYTGMALGTLGEALRVAGDSVAAIAPLERSLAILEKKASAEVPTAQFALARALHDARRDRSRARSLAQAARAGYAASGRDTQARQAEAWMRELGKR